MTNKYMPLEIYLDPQDIFDGVPFFETFETKGSVKYIQAENNWQPIETAPNMTKILVFYRNRNGKGRIIKAFKCGKYESENSGDDGGDWSEYCDEKDAYFDPPGWYEKIDNWDDFTHVTVTEGEPTHWMPLPEPPK